MKASRSFQLSQAYVLKSEDVASLVKDLEETLPRIRLKITCTDKVDREFEDYREFAEFKNPAAKAITSLRIRASSQNVDNVLIILFRRTQYYNIDVSIDGDEEAVNRLFSLVQEKFPDLKPWYHVLAIASAGYWLFALPYIFGFVLGPMSKALRSGSLVLSNIVWDFSAKFWTASLLSGFVLLIFFTFLDRFRQWAFPMGEFAIAQGAKRHANSDNWRVGLGLGILAAMIWAILTLPFS